ncbi:MAG: PQQ-binding-like beta-propeller repeat protein [Pirellulales bacterium]
MTRCGVLAICLLVSSGPYVLPATAETNYFRHDGGVATNDGPSPPDHFDDPNRLLWRRPLPSGHSTPCVAGRLLVLTTFEGERTLATVAVDRETGSTVWRQEAPNDRLEPYHRVGSPAASTPASDGERVFVFLGSYGLLCYDLQGALLWSKPMGPFQDEFGSASSAVLADGKVILSQDHDTDSFVMAVDAATGETVWKTARPDATRSYATPVIYQQGDEKFVVVTGALQLTAYNLETGEPRWWLTGLARIANTTPAQADNVLYVATWSPGGGTSARIAMEAWSEAVAAYDKNADRNITRDELPEASPVLLRFFRIDLNQDGKLGEAEWNKHAEVFRRATNGVLAVRPSGRGDLRQTDVKWAYRKGVPFVASPLLYQNVLYLVKDGGIATTLDPRTGALYRQRRLPGRGNYYASPVAADGKIYIASARGVLSVLEAGPRWKLLSSRDFGEPIYATPVIDGERIYVRTAAALYCFAK